MRICTNARHFVTHFGIKLIWLLLLGGCLTPIEVETENIGGTLVVSGQISPLADQNIVTLGLTAETERLPFPLSGATVRLHEDTGETYEYSESPFVPGEYLLPWYSGIPGRTYYVEIITPDGQAYQSSPEKMPEVAGALTTHYEFVTEQYVDLEGIISEELFIKVYTNSELPSTEGSLYLKWNCEEAFLLSPTDFPDPFGSIPPPCYVVQNADPQRVTLIDGKEIATTSIDNLLVVSRIIDWTFLEKHFFSIYQSSLTMEAYEYWRKVNVLANQVGSIFDTPPAEIIGNVHNPANPEERVLGYFQATNQTVHRFDVYHHDLPYPLNVTTCTYSGGRFDYPGRCFDCTSIRNSSFRRPFYF